MCSQTQDPLRKKPSFEVNLHINVDENHSIQHLHNVKHTKLGHEHYIVHFITNLVNCFESFLSRVYTSFVEL